MKKLLLPILLFTASYSYAQNTAWPAPNSTDKVGIGTPSPASLLTLNSTNVTDLLINRAVGKYARVVFSTGDAPRWYIGLYNDVTPGTENFVIETPTSTKLVINSAGYVGVGAVNPVSTLDVAGSINLSNNYNLTWGGAYGAGTPAISAATNLGLYFYPGGSTSGSSMVIRNSGYVGIGTNNPDQMLSGKGTIHSQAVQVDMSGWNDYVFDKNYALTSLKDVETYIDQNHHLPEIPSAAQVVKEGVNLGEMNAKLLKKIEELTLYLISKDENDKKLHEEIDLLKKQVNDLSASISNK